jgi:hypothetical protein
MAEPSAAPAVVFTAADFEVVRPAAAAVSAAVLPAAAASVEAAGAAADAEVGAGANRSERT